ncbi:hypothetical protein KIS1582_3712 [Cytobacillus firmus]|uniref:Uncharacterized protein n=1 Tax=Cytobacillus firmus TaxID=1399 RepID=A0A800MUG2_CYTFI|nr:hypothetical protein KIS1582_3712 [Cytobacillus firmus]
MIKFVLIGAYIAHKIYWKQANKRVLIPWSNFFKGVA